MYKLSVGNMSLTMPSGGLISVNRKYVLEGATEMGGLLGESLRKGQEEVPIKYVK